MAEGRAQFTAAQNVSRETLDRLDRYAALLEKWNPAINLVSRTTLPDLWTRHFLDSAQLFSLLPAGATHWADLGSGGGFPGLIIAILAAEAAPALKITLVESDARKSVFLSTTARALGLPTIVETARIEALAPLAADVLSARALGPLPQLLSHAARHLTPDGMALFPKGAAHAQELAEARLAWTFTAENIPSKTDPDAVILSIRGIAHV